MKVLFLLSIELKREATSWHLMNAMIKAVCKKTDEYEKENVESIYTMYFDKDKILKKSTTVIIEKDMDKQTYNEKKKSYDEMYKEPEYKNVIYKKDDKKRTFSTETSAEYSFSDADKGEYEAGKYIKSYEDMNYKCSIYGSSRKALGLK